MKKFLLITLISLSLGMNAGFIYKLYKYHIDRENGYKQAGCTINEGGSLLCPLGLDDTPVGIQKFCIGNHCVEITESTLMSQEIYCQKYDFDGDEYASCSLIDVPVEMLDSFNEYNLTPEQAFGSIRFLQ